jgi:hypothetical protein
VRGLPRIKTIRGQNPRTSAIKKEFLNWLLFNSNQHDYRKDKQGDAEDLKHSQPEDKYLGIGPKKFYEKAPNRIKE